MGYRLAKLFGAPHAFFFFLALFFQPRFLARCLFADFIHLIKFLISQSGVELLLQEYFAFRELALIDALNLSEARFFSAVSGAVVGSDLASRSIASS